MNPEVKEQWIAALRSGEYPQGKGALNRNGNYCCLGVLTDLAVKAGVCEWSTDYTGWHGIWENGDHNSTTLSEPVMDWAGLDKIDPWVENKSITLAALNDGTSKQNPLDFNEIADIIEREPSL